MSVFEIIPGQKVVNSVRNDRMEICTIEFSLGDQTLTADLLMPLNAPLNATPLVGNVRRHKQLLWNFQSRGFEGRAHLLWLDDQVVIAYVGRSTGAVEEVDVVKRMIGGLPLGLTSSVQLKYAAAEELNIDRVQLTASEQQVSVMINADRVRQQEEERAERQAKKAAQKAERDKRRAAIMGRQELKLQGPGGRKLHGRPVLEDEWQGLSDGSWVVVVSTYNDGHVGDLLRHGVVSKKGGNPVLKSVTTELQWLVRSEQAASDAPKPIGKRLFKIDGDVHEVSLYRIEDLVRLKQVGVIGLFAAYNGGELVAGRIFHDGSTVKTVQLQAKEFA